MNILVTGGCGFVGSALVKRLVGEGGLVGVLDDCSRGKRERLEDVEDEIVFFGADVRDAMAVTEAVQWADVIWHLAYVQGTQVFTENPHKTIDVALNGIMNILNACVADGLPKELILVSSSEAYNIPPEGMVPTDETVPLTVPDPRNPRFAYGGGKIASEVAVMSYAYGGALARATVVRPHNIYGPDAGYEHVIPQLARRVLALAPGENLVIQGTGEETRSFNYIDDAVDGLLLVGERGENREIYHLGTMQEVSIRNLARTIMTFYGRKHEIVTSELPKGSPPRRQPDISKLKALGYEPKTSLLEGLATTLKWYAANPENPVEEEAWQQPR